MSPFVSRFVPEIARWAERAELPAFEPRRNEGLLRTLTIREGKRTGQRLVTLETERGGAPPDDLGARFVAAVTQIAQQLNGAVDSIHWLQRDAERGRKTTWTAQHLFGNTELAEKLQLPNGRTLTFSIGPRAFFQPSTLGAEAIYTEVIAQSSLQPSTLQSGLRDGAAQTVLDLYCGTGTIGLCLAPWAERVIGIELNEEAAHNARRNAERNGITNIELHCGDAAKVLQELALPSAGIDVVVVDPPRAGLNGKAIEQIVRLAPKRLVYVACSPKSLARDAALLRDRGYGLTTVQPIDQFPQTGHIECVATLLRLPVT